MAHNALEVEFCEEILRLDPGTSLTFGRQADLVVDTNPFLHRVVGRIAERQGRWWIENLGTKIPVEIYDRSSGSSAVLMPKTDQVIPGPDVVVRFAAGPSTYELDVRGASTSPTTGQVEQIHTGNTTSVLAPDVALTTKQLQVVLALGEDKLRTPQAPLQIPASKVAAKRLRWPLHRFNRQLENVCEKLSRAGVPGLKAQPGDVAHNRRERLVEYCIEAGIADDSMLHLLDQDDLES